MEMLLINGRRFALFSKIFKYIFFVAARIAWDFFVNTISSSKVLPNIFRSLIYKLFGINTKTYNINPDCFFTYFTGKKVTIGKNSMINYGCFFDNTSSIDIGDDVFVAFNTMFCTSSHEVGSENRRAGKGIGQPIKVEDGVWIGARATILPGVTIGKGCIIAAGTVIHKDCEPNGLYAGIPAKRVKELDFNESIAARYVAATSEQ